MSAASGGLVARRAHTGTTSSYVPRDLRTEDPRPAAVQDDAATVTALVVARLGAAAHEVLAPLGLAVAS